MGLCIESFQCCENVGEQCIVRLRLSQRFFGERGGISLVPNAVTMLQVYARSSQSSIVCIPPS